MARWLLKTEPSNYSWEQMENDCTIRWTGIG
ncbi:MAG TPA: EVE domain-containing protein, partial [Candidatus Poseidoniia archaeon]|nr:EVE domain-containing protein [Candidatus Poseidoniia archaeon]